MPNQDQRITRRTALAALAAGGVAAGAVAAGSAVGRGAVAAEALSSPAPVVGPTGAAKSPGRLKQSFCRWPYARTPLAEVCRRAKLIGFPAIDLLYPEEWPVARDAGLTVSMGYASRREKFIATGFNDPANHALLIDELQMAIPLAASSHVPNVIAMFGNRVPGIDDATAIANCVAGLARVSPAAEKYGVTVCVELLNSKVDHAGYQGDHTAFGLSNPLHFLLDILFIDNDLAYKPTMFFFF